MAIYISRLYCNQCRLLTLQSSNTYKLRFLNVVFSIRNVVIHMAYSNTYTLRFLNVVFPIRNVVIHMAYSYIAYLRSVSSLLSLPPLARCDWSSLPALSSSAQSVSCFHVQYFRNITYIVTIITCIPFISSDNWYSSHVIYKQSFNPLQHPTWQKNSHFISCS